MAIITAQGATDFWAVNFLLLLRAESSLMPELSALETASETRGE